MQVYVHTAHSVCLASFPLSCAGWLGESQLHVTRAIDCCHPKIAVFFPLCLGMDLCIPFSTLLLRCRSCMLMLFDTLTAYSQRIQGGFIARTNLVLVQCNPGLAVLVAKGN